MNNSLAETYLKDYQKKINIVFDNYQIKKITEAKKIGIYPKDLTEKLFEMAKLGKKIRGALVVLGYQLGGGKKTNAIYDVSLSQELFHTGLLIHDDIMDNSNLRRGIKTIHKFYEELKSPLFGKSLAICIADAAFYMAWEKLLDSKFSLDCIINAAKIYTKYAIRVAHGQILDVYNNSLKNINEKDILKVMWIKSGEYSTLLPLRFGAALSGLKDRKRLTAIEKYAKCLGWAFQIKDDILGIFGDENKIGKSNLSDIKEGKFTLLMLYLLKHGNSNEIKIQKEIFGNPKSSEKELLAMRKILKDSNTLNYVTNLGWDYVKEGKKYIPQITKDKKIQDMLSSFLYFVMDRNS